MLASLTDTDSVYKGGKIIWHIALEYSFKKLKCMVSSDNLFNYPDWIIIFAVHTDDSYKQFVAVFVIIINILVYSLEDSEIRNLITLQWRRNFSQYWNSQINFK